MYELSILSLIALCLVSFIGVPHGSFDGAVAALLGYQSKKRFLTFIFLVHDNLYCSNLVLDKVFP